MISGERSNMPEIYAEKVSLETAREIYGTYMKTDFPPEEIKPFPVIEKMWKKNSYFAYVFYEKGAEKHSVQNMDSIRIQDKNDGQSVPCAYAFLLADNKEHVLLLDYFAVLKMKRGKGYGSHALSLLKGTCTEWKMLLIEVENDELTDIDEETRAMRRRRISFYTEAGCLMTDVRSRLWGVDYRIMFMPLADGHAGRRIGERLKSLYRGMYDEKKLKTNFEILSE